MCKTLGRNRHRRRFDCRAVAARLAPAAAPGGSCLGSACSCRYRAESGQNITRSWVPHVPLLGRGFQPWKGCMCGAWMLTRRPMSESPDMGHPACSLKPFHPDVISTEAARHHRAAQWRDPCIFLLPLSAPSSWPPQGHRHSAKAGFGFISREAATVTPRTATMTPSESTGPISNQCSASILTAAKASTTARP